MDTQTETWHHSLIIDDTDPIDELGYDWSPPPHGSFLGHDGSLASPVTVDQAFMNSKYMPAASPISPEAQDAWSPDVYKDGLKRLSRFAEGLTGGDAIAVEEVDEAQVQVQARDQHSYLAVETHETSRYHRPPTPSPQKLSNLSPVAEVPPLPSSLPARTLPKVPSSPPVLKRAYTMRSPARPTFSDPPRPRSSSQAHSHSENYQKLTGEFEFTVPVAQSRPRRPSKSSMRKLSVSSRSATPVNIIANNVGLSEAQTGVVGVWEPTEDKDGTLDIPDLRPRAPTPSATASAFQYPVDLSSPGTPFSAASTAPSFSAAQQSVLASRAATSTTRARSRSVSTGRPGTSPPPPAMPSTASMVIPDEYTTEPFTVPVPAPPTTPPRSFARPPKAAAAYPDPNGFPTPPSYPPVPGLVASGSASTSTRSSAYTSPGTSIPLSSSDLSAVGLGLTARAELYHAGHHDDDEEDEVVLDMGVSATPGVDKALPSLPRKSAYATSASASVSESSITRLQMATNAAAQSATHTQTITPNSSWTSDAYPPSTRSGSSYDGSPVPLSRNASTSAIRDHKKKTPMASSLWRSEDELDDENEMEEQEQEQPSVSAMQPPSTSMSFSYQRPRQGTFASSRSASVSGLTSASEDETDADDYPFLREIEEVADEEVRTAAIVVAEEGRGLIVHGEGMDVTAVNIQPGTTHLLLSSSASPHSIPGLLTQTLPNIASTLLALDISANFLGALPPALAACTQLTELNVASNPLRALPVWLSSLDQLRVLIADATGISTLPVELSSLKALNVLSIRRNKFVSLPPWLSYLSELERLEVEGNPFQGPWKALTAPLVATRAANTTPQPQQTQSQMPQHPSISTSSSTSDLGSVYGPGMSLYGDSLYSHPPLTPGSGVLPVQGPSSVGYDEPDGMGAGVGSNQANGSGRKLVNSNEEEDHTIMPRRSLYASSSQLSLPSVPLTPSQFPLPTTPMTPAIPPSAAPSHQSFASSINSPSQLPYMSSPRPDSDVLMLDKQEGSSSSPLQRVPTFSSVPDRGLRTPSPYLRPLSRTRTTPSRPTRMSSGSVATFVADVGHGERSRTSSASSQQQRPHTDYVSRYKASTASGSSSNGNLEDSGYYGSVNVGDYSAYRRSDGSEFFANGYDHPPSTSQADDERSNQMRRMRSADELRRALEPVIGPSEPLALPDDDDNGGSATETDRRPPFYIPSMPRVDMRPGLKHNFTSGDAETISPGKGMPLAERPPAKRFASVGPMASVATKTRLALTDSMWDNGADADADVEPDNEDMTLRKSRPTSPDPSEVPQQPQTQRKSRKWGFFKKMSMGRMRPDTSSGSGSGSGKPSRSVSGSTQTSPQGGSISRAGIIPPPNIITSNGASPSPKMRHQPSRDRLAGNLSPLPPSASPITPLSATARSPGLGVPQSRAAKRRSFLPLDGPPALNIPIPRTSPFMPEALIVTNDEDEGARNAITPVMGTPPTLPAATPTLPANGPVSAISPGPPSSSLTTISAMPPPPPSSEQQQQPQVQGPEADAQHSRALRSVMAYLRDMADLGMANSSVPACAVGVPPAAPSDAPTTEARSRRPTVVEVPRVMSDGSLASSAGSSSLRSEEQRANTMSVATTESDGSGKAEEEKPARGVKDDKVRRAALVKEIVDTERTYVQGLQELIDIYIKPASQPVNTIGNAVAGTKETVVPAAERKIAFNGVDSLYSFHSQSFLPALEKAARPLMMQLARPDTDIGEVSMAAALAVANVFVSHAAFMRMYSTYINNFDNAVARLKAWAQDPRRTPGGALSPSSSTAQLAGMVMSVVNVPTPEETGTLSGLPTITSSQRKRIKQFMKRARLNPKHSQINLESYLLLPVQRIPRYRLLLEELVRCTPPKLDMPDDPIDRALSEIASLANNMNEGKRESESRRRLVQWQSRIKGKFPSPLVQPHRRLIMDGPLNLKRVVRKALTSFDIINSEGTTSSVQVECLAPENTPRTLVGVLCNDLLVLCKDPSEGKDKNGPVDLWAVLRMQTLATPASINAQGDLRVVDNKAILYFDVPSSSSTDALTWCRAINMNVASKS